MSDILSGFLYMALFVFFVALANRSKQKRAQAAPEKAAVPVPPRSPESSQASDAASSPAGGESMMPEESMEGEYTGSLGPVHEEGCDPCHDEMPHARPVSPASAPAPEAPGLTLSWTKDDLVKGFIMSEVLNRRTR